MSSRADRRHPGRVVVVTTGGTIATTADADGVSRPTHRGADLVSGLPTTHDVEVVDLMAEDSSELGPPEWDAIATAVSSALGSGADGVVVTHGTDTMEETALWLDIAVGAHGPIVLTGAMYGADSPRADGPANLRDALVAAGPGGWTGGVAVCLGGVLWEPLGLTKTGSGFTGRAVGRIADGRVAHEGVARRPLLTGPLLTGPLHPSARVDVVTVYAGSDAVAIDAVVAAGARGIVLEALGSGNAGRAVVDGVRRARDGGVEVAVSSRVPGARVSPVYGPGRALADAGAVTVAHLRPPQARVLLMAALSAGVPVADVFAEWG